MSATRGLAVGIVDPAADDTGSARAWSGTETLMRLTSVARPRYPEPLRNAGLAGRVLVRFVVDTAGHVDLSSAEVLQSTHELFTHAVRDVLPLLRFRPAEVSGRRVRSLAEMPFEFQITR